MKARLIYCALTTYANSKGNCFPSHTTIGNGLGMTRKTVWIGIKELVNAGIIEQRNVKGKANQYHIPTCVKYTQGCVKYTQGGVSGLHTNYNHITIPSTRPDLKSLE